MAEDRGPSPRDRDGGFVDRLVPDPASPPDLKLLVGYPGASAEKGQVRLYASPDLGCWWEVPEDAVRHRAAIPGDPLGAQILWIQGDKQPNFKTGRSDSMSHYTYPTVTGPVTLHYCTYAAQAQGYTVPPPTQHCTWQAAGHVPPPITPQCTYQGHPHTMFTVVMTPACAPVTSFPGPAQGGYTYPPSPAGQAQGTVPPPITPQCTYQEHPHTMITVALTPACAPVTSFPGPPQGGYTYPPSPAGQAQGGQHTVCCTTSPLVQAQHTACCGTSPLAQAGPHITAYPTFCTVPPVTLGCR